MREFDEMFSDCLQVMVKQGEQAKPGKEHNGPFCCFKKSDSSDAAINIFFGI